MASSLAGAVFILKLHFRGHKTNRVPKWARTLFKIKRLNKRNSCKLNSKITNSFKTTQDEKEKTRKNSIHKLLDLIKHDMKKSKESQIKKQELDLILVEWRELSRKIEFIFWWRTCIISR